MDCNKSLKEGNPKNNLTSFRIGHNISYVKIKCEPFVRKKRH